jgi:hypothetical protein
MAEMVSREHRLDQAVKLVKKYLKGLDPTADKNIIKTQWGEVCVILNDDNTDIVVKDVVWQVNPETREAEVRGPRGLTRVKLCH